MTPWYVDAIAVVAAGLTLFGLLTLPLDIYDWLKELRK